MKESKKLVVGIVIVMAVAIVVVASFYISGAITGINAMVYYSPEALSNQSISSSVFCRDTDGGINTDQAGYAILLNPKTGKSYISATGNNNFFRFGTGSYRVKNRDFCFAEAYPKLVGFAGITKNSLSEGYCVSGFDQAYLDAIVNASRLDYLTLEEKKLSAQLSALHSKVVDCPYGCKKGKCVPSNKPAASLFFNVTDGTTGFPLANAQVSVYTKDSLPSAFFMGNGIVVRGETGTLFSVKTGADGTVLIPGLFAESYNLAVDKYDRISNDSGMFNNGSSGRFSIVGYRSFGKTMTLKAGQNNIDVSLYPAA